MPYILFLYLVISLIGFDLVGRFILGLLKTDINPKSYKITFFSLFIGIVSFVVITSIILTGFKTINLGFLLLVLLGYPYIKFNKKFIWYGYNNQHILILFGILVFNFLISYLIKSPSLEAPFPIYFGDHLYYTDISNYLINKGAENSYRVDNAITNINLGASPYHYFDLWLNAGISAIFNMPYILNLEIIINPLIRIIASIGILAILESHYKKNFNFYLIALLSIFISGIYLSVYSSIPVLFHWNHNVSNIYSYPKLNYNFIFIIACFLVFNKSNLKILTLLLLSLSLINIANAPGVFAGMVIGGFFLYYFHERNKDYWFIILTPIIISVFIISFYIVFKPPFETSLTPNLYDLLLGYFYQKLKLLVAQSISNVVFYSPFLLLLFSRGTRLKMLTFIKSNAIPLFILGVIVISALLFALLTYKMGDSYQFFDNLFIPIINIIIIYSIYFFVSEIGESNKYYVLLSSATLSIVLIFLCYKTSINDYELQVKRNDFYSRNYLNEIALNIKNIKNPVGVGFFNKEQEKWAHKPYFVVNNLGAYLPLMRKNFNTINITTFDWHIRYGDKNRYSAAWKSAAFTRYVFLKKKNNQFENLDKCKIDFINELGVQYIIAEEDAAIPATLLKDSKVITDPKSGERFIILNNAIR